MPDGKMEGIPVALMEAMAANVPVIATNISGIPELVKDGETGLLISPEDASQLAEAIMNIYKDVISARSKAANASVLVKHEFDLMQNIQQLSQLFDAIIGG
jgi:glycosyltransferase involved in cell wall biosynthesis